MGINNNFIKELERALNKVERQIIQKQIAEADKEWLYLMVLSRIYQPS